MSVCLLAGRLSGAEVHLIGLLRAIREGCRDVEGGGHACARVGRRLHPHLARLLINAGGPVFRQGGGKGELGSLRHVFTLRGGNAFLITWGDNLRVAHACLLGLPLAVRTNPERDSLGGGGLIRVGGLNSNLELLTSLQRTLRGHRDVAVVLGDGDVEKVTQVAQQILAQLEGGASRDLAGAVGGCGATSCAVGVGDLWPGRVVLRIVALIGRGGVAVLIGHGDFHISELVGLVRVGDLDANRSGRASAKLAVRRDSHVAVLIHAHRVAIRPVGDFKRGAHRQGLGLVVRNSGLAFLDRQRSVADIVGVGVVVTALHDLDGGLVLAHLFVAGLLVIELVHTDGHGEAGAWLGICRRLHLDHTGLVVGGEGVAVAISRAGEAVGLRVARCLRRLDFTRAASGDL